LNEQALNRHRAVFGVRGTHAPGDFFSVHESAVRRSGKLHLGRFIAGGDIHHRRRRGPLCIGDGERHGPHACGRENMRGFRAIGLLSVTEIPGEFERPAIRIARGRCIERDLQRAACRLCDSRSAPAAAGDFRGGTRRA
jgi:hypothetical protein